MEALIENKNDFLEHLEDITSPSICQYFINIGNRSKNLNEFQKDMVSITKFGKKDKSKHISIINGDIIDDNITIEYLEKLIKEIITLCVKIKISEYKTKLNSIRIRIPDWTEFLYKIMIECAKIFWKNCVLFYRDVSSVEKQANINKIEKFTLKCIRQTLRSYIPIEKIVELMERSNNVVIDSVNDSESNKKNVYSFNYKKLEEEEVDNSDNSEDEEDNSEDEDNLENSEEDVENSENEEENSENEEENIENFEEDIENAEEDIENAEEDIENSEEDIENSENEDENVENSENEDENVENAENEEENIENAEQDVENSEYEDENVENSEYEDENVENSEYEDEKEDNLETTVNYVDNSENNVEENKDEEITIKLNDDNNSVLIESVDDENEIKEMSEPMKIVFNNGDNKEEIKEIYVDNAFF